MSEQSTDNPSARKRPRVLVTYQSERGLDTLFHRELRVSPPSDFNDPFELRLASPAGYTTEQLKAHYLSQTAIPWLIERPKHSSDEAYMDWVQQAVKAPRHKHAQIFSSVRDTMIDVLGKYRGVACFSALTYKQKPPSLAAAKTTALMWAHYANKHRGLMIEFDIRSLVLTAWLKSGWLFRVHYHKNRPVAALEDFDLGSDGKSIDQLTMRWASPKFNAWAYEREWRLICPFVPEKDPQGFTNARMVDGKLMHFAALRPAIGKPATPWLETSPVRSIKRVVLGQRATKQFKKDVIHVLESPAYKHVHIQEAQLSSRSFGLDYVDIRKPGRGRSQTGPT